MRKPMTSVAITTRRPPIPPTPAGQHPKAYLRTRDVNLMLPFAPRGGTMTGRAPTYEQVPRPGRRPLVVRTGDGVLSLTHTYTLGYPDHQQSVDPVLAVLRRIAADGDRVTLVNLSPDERGPWVISSLEETWDLRQHGTNAVTRATVTVTYLEESEADVKLGPIKGGKNGKGKGTKLPTKHKLKAGETLAKLADRYYGEPSKWPLIAKANKISKPNNLKDRVGDNLTIPKPPASAEKDNDKDKEKGK